MIGITVFNQRLIILFALKHFWKHSPHGIFIETVSVTRDDALDKQYWISQSGESHDSMTHLVNKYVTCTHSGQYLIKCFRSMTMSGSVVECLTRDRGDACSSLTGVTALCPWANYINPSLVLVQPRKTRSYITERVLMGRKESQQTNRIKLSFFIKGLYEASTYLYCNLFVLSCCKHIVWFDSLRPINNLSVIRDEYFHNQWRPRWNTAYTRVIWKVLSMAS